jgi:hypothetical protein
MPSLDIGICQTTTQSTSIKKFNQPETYRQFANTHNQAGPLARQIYTETGDFLRRELNTEVG